MNRLYAAMRRFTGGAMLCLGLTLPASVHATTVANVCAELGNSCVGGTANINVATTVTCDSTLNFTAAGFPFVNVNSGGSLNLEDVSNCFMELVVGDLTVQSAGRITANKTRNNEPGRVTVHASGAIQVAQAGRITAIGGPRGPHPTIELFAGANVTLAGIVEARGTTARGFGGHIIIESVAGLVTVPASGRLKASGTDPGGTLIAIRACQGIEIAGLVDASGRKREAQVQLFSREQIRILGGTVRADLRIAELDAGDEHRVVMEARGNIILNNAEVSADSRTTNKVGGDLEILSTEGAVSCSGSELTANAPHAGSTGGVVRLRGLMNVTYNCDIQAQSNEKNGTGGTILLQSFAQNVSGPAGDVDASGKVPGTIVLRAAANPIANGGNFTPAPFLNAGAPAPAPVSGVNFAGGIPACGAPAPPAPANQCPAITVMGGTNQTIQAGQTLSVQVSALDPDGGQVTLTATGLPANASFAPNPAIGTPGALGTLTFTPTAAQANQVFNFIFTASDNQGCSAGLSPQVVVSMTVTPGPAPNQCPVITVFGGTNRTVQVGQTLMFNVSSTDPDGGSVALSAIVATLPPGASFTPNPALGTPTATGTFSFTPTAAQANQMFNVLFATADFQGCSGALAPRVWVTITVTPAPPPPPACQPATANSSAFGVSVDLTLVPLLGPGIPVIAGPVPTVSGTAPPAYNKTANLASLTVSSPMLATLLETGVLLVKAKSTVPSSHTASAEATVADPRLDLQALLGLDATVVQSTTDIAGTCGTMLAAAGTTTIANAVTSGLLGVGVMVPTNPAPNTVLLNAAGVRVILNEQIVGGNGTGINSQELTVNAVHVELTNALLIGQGLLSGDIIISQSQAQVGCVCTGLPLP